MIGLEYIVNLYNYQFKDIAEQLGVSKQVVNGWIKGRYKISRKHLPKLSNIFNVPEQYFQKELTELDKCNIQEIKLSNEVIKHEYEDTILNGKGEHIKVTRVFNEGVDIDGLRLNDIEKKKLYIKDNVDKAIYTNMNKQSPYIFGDKISIGEYVVDLYKDFNELITDGEVRLDIIKDIVNGMKDFKEDSNQNSLKRNTYTKRITREVRKEQLKRDEEDRINLQQEQEAFINEEIRRYEEEQQPISEEEKERRKMMSKLFK